MLRGTVPAGCTASPYWRAAKNTGKAWAATCGTLEQARRMVNMGARLVFHRCDIGFVKNGLDHEGEEFGAFLRILRRLPE